MYKRYLCCILVILAFCEGCKDPVVEQLRKENPFRAQPKRDLNKIIFVMCNFLVFEVPSHIDIGQLEFWKKAVPYSSDYEYGDLIVSGMDKRQVENWSRNGLKLAVAPLEKWELFSEELLKLGAEQYPEKAFMFRNAREIAELPAYWIGPPIPVFTFYNNRSTRGFTLAAGDCLFQLSCLPPRTADKNEDVFVKLTPMFRSTNEQFRPSNNQLGFVREFPHIIFDSLILSGTVRPHTMLAITVNRNANSVNTVGKVFLARKIQEDNYQLVFLLAPRIQTAAEIKAQSAGSR